MLFRSVRSLTERVDSTNVAEAIAIAALPDSVRGYEHLKMQRAEAFRAELTRRIAAFV